VSGEKGRRDQGFAEGADVFALAVGHEEIEFAVLCVGDQRRRDLVEGVPEAEFLFP